MIPQYLDFKNKGLKIILSSQKDWVKETNKCDYIYSDEVYNAEQILKQCAVTYEGGFFSSELKPCDIALFKKTSEDLMGEFGVIKKAVVDLLTGAKKNVTEVLELLEKLPEY
jgi:hypothetical protein